MMSLCLMGVLGIMLEKWKGCGQSSRQSGTGTTSKPGLSDPTSWLSPLVIAEGLRKNREVLSIKALSASMYRGGQWRECFPLHIVSGSGHCQGASPSPIAQSARVAFHYSLNLESAGSRKRL